MTGTYRNRSSRRFAVTTISAIIYHFHTRAQLMSEVITFVYEQGQRPYQELQHQGCEMSKAEDWPAMLWTVFSQPAGMALIEMLQASRSDP